MAAVAVAPVAVAPGGVLTPSSCVMLFVACVLCVCVCVCVCWCGVDVCCWLRGGR